MPDPKRGGHPGRPKSTGRYNTREELEREVIGWMRINNSYAKTARIVEVSARTVAEIYRSAPPAAKEADVKKTPTDYQPGDVCYLLSGSRRMTVEKVADDRVHCVWQHFDTTEILRADFDPLTLSRSPA